MNMNAFSLMRKQNATQMKTWRVFIHCATLCKSVSITTAVFCGFFVASLSASADGVSPYAGLWAGTVALRTVNEVSIAKDANNVDVAPNPAIPTVTSDRADMLLLLHVNGAGQVSLLKDVAVVNRNVSGAAAATLAEIAAAGSDESALSLVTDPRLYAEFPMQKAVRLSSVVFDFGDAQATAAVDALVSNVVAQVKDYVQNVSFSAIDTIAERNEIVNTRGQIIADAQAGLVAAADVAAAFGAFLGQFTPALVLSVAQAPGGGDAQDMTAAAADLEDASFFGDTRALEMVAAVKAAGTNEALNVAASFADTGNLYQRFVCGKLFGDALLAAAFGVSTNPAVTLTELKQGVASDATMEALRLQALASAYTDTRAVTALDTVLNAVIAAALANSGKPPAEIEELSAAAGKAALAELVARYPVPQTAPTGDYTAFVTSAAFKTGAPLTAARAALAAALLEKAENPLTWQTKVPVVARDAAVNALQTVYSSAALAVRNELPLKGAFGLGLGDPRFTADVLPQGELGLAGLTGTVRLPANHPTNPFRHRRNPDHATGFDITRNIRIDFDGNANTNGVVPAAFGVTSVTGMYREEVLGLHKPLGPNQNIGLRTEGRFQLNRVSRIDTLNAK
ncbi:MAG: hypothetical protein PHV28_05735 [Kiritimatiellae bacterium]|nr:hypothetical protein [Kiritimatiellia bacterium]